MGNMTTGKPALASVQAQGEELAIFALIEAVQDDDRSLERPRPPGQHQWQSEGYILSLILVVWTQELSML